MAWSLTRESFLGDVLYFDAPHDLDFLPKDFWKDFVATTNPSIDAVSGKFKIFVRPFSEREKTLQLLSDDRVKEMHLRAELNKEK